MSSSWGLTEFRVLGLGDVLDSHRARPWEMHVMQSRRLEDLGAIAEF